MNISMTNRNLSISPFSSDFSNDILNYLKKEASYGAIIGPFKNNPFVSELKISPLNTVTKIATPNRVLEWCF
jgi:hypothetical protein